MNRSLLLMLVAMPMMGQTPPLPKLPHVQRVKLDAKSAESEAHGRGVQFHNDALESCDPGWRLEAKNWWLPNPVNIKDNLCYKDSPDGQWWHEVPADSPLLAPDPPKPDAKQVTTYVFGKVEEMKSIEGSYSVGDMKATTEFHNAVDVDSQTGRVVKLSNAEYSRLQKLRHAVVDAETEIAKAHGVKLLPELTHKGSNACNASFLTGGQSCDVDIYSAPDRYEYRGQFLLIGVPEKQVIR